MRKIIPIILIMSIMASYIYSQDNWNILAVDTNTHSINLTNQVIDMSGATSVKVPYNTSSNDAAQVYYVDNSFSTRTTLLNTTGSVEVANSTSFIIPLLYSPVELVDCRFYLGTTNGAPVSKRATFRIMQKPYDRCNDLVYMYTNQLYFSTTTTLAGASDTFTNVVGDASGFIINDMYTKPTTSPQTWQTVSNYTSTVVSWNCSNIVSEATGTLVSHVNRWRLSLYNDLTGGTNLYVNLSFNTPYTNQISWSCDYYRK